MRQQRREPRQMARARPAAALWENVASCWWDPGEAVWNAGHAEEGGRGVYLLSASCLLSLTAKVCPITIQSMAFCVVVVARASGSSEVRPRHWNCCCLGFSNHGNSMSHHWQHSRQEAGLAVRAVGDRPPERIQELHEPGVVQFLMSWVWSHFVFWKLLLCASIDKCKALTPSFSYRSCGWRVPMSKWHKFVTSTSLASCKKCKCYISLHC